MASRMLASGAPETKSTEPSALRCIPSFVHKRCEIDRGWLIVHLVVEVRQHGGAGGLVAHGERAFDVPVLSDHAASIEDAAQRILQAHAIVGLLPDADIGHQAKHCSAPVGASPRVGAVETLIAGLRFALRHVAHHVRPHVFSGELAGLHPGDRFDVNRYAFFDPVMVLRHRRKGEVDHLVRKHPVAVQLRHRGARAYGDRDHAAAVCGIGDAVMNPGTAAHVHVEREMRDRILAVVRADGGGGALDPVQQVIA